MANAAAFALDSMEDTDIVGTLAGDDTVLLVFHDSAHAADFCETGAADAALRREDRYAGAAAY